MIDNKEIMTEFDIKQRLFLNGKYHSTQFNKWLEEALTKKDQEHKAELEMIKGEMKELGFSICSAHQKHDDNCFLCKSSSIRTEDAISILDKHINK